MAAAVAGIALMAFPALASAQSVAEQAATAVPPAPLSALAPTDGNLAAAETDLTAAVQRLTAFVELKTARLGAEGVLKSTDLQQLVEAAETHARAAEIDARQFELARADITVVSKSAHDEAMAGREAAAEANRIVAELKPQFDDIKRKAMHLKPECKTAPEKCVIVSASGDQH
jgi:hypothetical protein